MKAMEEEAAKSNTTGLISYGWMIDEPKALTLRLIGSALAKVGAHNEAHQAWQDAVDAASAVNDLETKVDILTDIADAQTEDGDAKGVLGWAEKRKTPKLKLVALQGLAEGIIARKAPRSAMIFAIAREPSPSDAFSARALPRHGRPARRRR